MPWQQDVVLLLKGIVYSTEYTGRKSSMTDYPIKNQGQFERSLRHIEVRVIF